MARIEKQVSVQVPIDRAYAAWSNFEQFPRFMEGVEEVRRDGERGLHWKASIAGKTEEWDAQITELTPNERVAWSSTSGAQNSGVVSFAPSGAETQIDLVMEYEPEGIVESTGDMLGLVERRVEGDLERFKEYVESPSA